MREIVPANIRTKVEEQKREAEGERRVVGGRNNFSPRCSAVCDAIYYVANGAIKVNSAALSLPLPESPCRVLANFFAESTKLIVRRRPIPSVCRPTVHSVISDASRNLLGRNSRAEITVRARWNFGGWWRSMVARIWGGVVVWGWRKFGVDSKLVAGVWILFGAAELQHDFEERRQFYARWTI